MRTAAALLCLTLPGMLAGTAAAPQDETPPAAAAPAPPAGPLSTLELARRLDDIAAEITAIDAYLPDTAELVAAKKTFDGLDPAVERALARAARRWVENLSPIGRDTLVASLERLDREIETGRRPLGARVERLEKSQQVLRAGAELIRTALSAPDVEDLPETQRARMNSLVTSIERTRARVRSALDVAVMESERAATMQQQLADAQRVIQDVTLIETRAALRRDQPPIWRPAFWTVGKTGEVRQRVTDSAETLGDLMNLYPGRWLLLGLVLLSLVIGTFKLRQAALADGDAPSRELIVQHPVAAAVLIWAAIGPDLVDLRLPASVGSVRVVIVVAAVWPLIGLMATEAARLPLRGLLVLAVVSVWADVLLGANAGAPVFLILGIAALLLLLELDRAGARALLSGSPRLNSLLRIVVRLGALLLGLAIVAVAAGANRLGRQFIEGVMLFTLIPTILAVASQSAAELWDQVLERSPIRRLRAVQHYEALLKRRGRQLINLAMLAIVIPVVPRILPFSQPLWAALAGLLDARLEVGGISLSAGDVLALLIGITLAIVLARFVRFALDEDVVPRLPVAPGAAAAATRLLYYLLLTVGLLMALAAAGFELTQLTLVVSAFGVGIGFGLQNIVSNFISGIVLAFERPFQAGDLIAVGQNTGRIRDIGLRATTVKTLEGAEVIVPNSTFISGEVINWTLSDRMRRIQLPVGVAYGSDPHRVQALLLEVCHRIEDVAKDPEPVVVFTGFGDSSLDFRILVWTPDADRLLLTTSELAMAVHDALKSAGIEIPFPQRDVHIRSTVAGQSSGA